MKDLQSQNLHPALRGRGVRGLFPIASRRKLCKQRSCHCNSNTLRNCESKKDAWMENNRIWLGKANIVASKFENKCIQKFDAHRILSILFLLTACWKCLALAMLDGCHHSWSFCDLLEAFKQTQQVRPEMTRNLLDLFQTTFTFINKFWVKTTDIVLSQRIPHLQAK